MPSAVVLLAYFRPSMLFGTCRALRSVAAAEARLASKRLQLTYATVVAPDAGVVSARTATLGAVASVGQELFRLIRGNRLEWRAEVTASELARIRPGMAGGRR